MYTVKNFFGHLKTILHHKTLVRRHCFKVGLYRQGIMHDWSKYSPVEFLAGVKYYQGGKRSPNFGEKEAIGYSRAWLHHKGRNKHHFEYWIDYTMKPEDGLQGMKMPLRYVIEMFCDRVAASKNYNGADYTDADAWNYYSNFKGEHVIHPETRALLENLLLMLRDQGEDATFSYIKHTLLPEKTY